MSWPRMPGGPFAGRRLAQDGAVDRIDLDCFRSMLNDFDVFEVLWVQNLLRHKFRRTLICLKSSNVRCKPGQVQA